MQIEPAYRYSDLAILVTLPGTGFKPNEYSYLTMSSVHLLKADSSVYRRFVLQTYKANQKKKFRCMISFNRPSNIWALFE